MVFWVVFVYVIVDYYSFGGILFFNQEDGFVLFGDGVDEKFCMDIVYYGNKNGVVFWGVVCWVMVRFYFIVLVLLLVW